MDMNFFKSWLKKISKEDIEIFENTNEAEKH